MTVPRTFEEAEAVLAASLPGYESRPQQQALARSIEAALRSGTHLLAEAGCGTGKSLGYLIPAILAPGRTVVSTATKALQDQIAGKDLPFLSEHLGVPFTYAVLKGRSNYLCRWKAMEADVSEVRSVPLVLRRADEEGFSGERDDLGFEVTDAEWRGLTVSSEECMGKAECPYGKSCFAEAAKAKAKESKIVVINHALAFVDLMLRQIAPEASMVDAYDRIIFDEAHECEDYAGNVLGSQVAKKGITSLASEVRTFCFRHDLDPEAADKLATDLITAAETMWEVIKPGRLRAADLLEHEESWVGLVLAAQDLSDFMLTVSLEMVPQMDLEGVKKRRMMLGKRLVSLSNKLVEIAGADMSEVVRWVEETGSYKNKTMVVRYAPINVGAILREWLFDRDTDPVSAILVSATMSANGSFDYIADRLGIDHYESIDVGTPFDYKRQSLLYIPNIPEPTGDTRRAWESASIAEMRELVMASKGRALLLFTSVKQMREAHDAIASTLPFKCLMQGEASNKALAAEFAADTHSVLFATRSFFTGVDFQGDTCSLVIIDKLPFPVPTDPMVEARCDAIKARGGSDFTEYSVPFMSLVLKQGFGRLIRHRNDSGVVAILDPRLQTKPYGRRMVADLPPARLVRSLDDVRAFFGEVA